MAKTRTYDEIYDDICVAAVDLTAEPGSAEFSTAWAADCERRRELWDEIARLADRDGAPGWAQLAVTLLRDKYARDARDAREEAERRARR